MSELSEGKYQKQVSTLPALDSYDYENIFKVFTNNDGIMFYNLLDSVKFPQELDSSVYDWITVSQEKMPWTMLSYKVYGTIKLWWLICIVNNIANPVNYPPVGTALKIIKQDYVSSILEQITSLS